MMFRWQVAESASSSFHCASRAGIGTTLRVLQLELQPAGIDLQQKNEEAASRLQALALMPQAFSPSCSHDILFNREG